MRRDSKVDAINTMVAEKMVCVCDGRRNPRLRARRDRAGEVI